MNVCILNMIELLYICHNLFVGDWDSPVIKVFVVMLKSSVPCKCLMFTVVILFKG